MLSQNFFDSLRFFDKDSVNQKKLNYLKQVLHGQKRSGINKISRVSQAMVPLLMWIAAIVDYHKAKAFVQPYRNEVKKVEVTLRAAQEVYVSMRQEMLTTKATMEETVVSHHDVLKRAKNAEAEVQVYIMYRPSINSSFI